MRSIRPIRMLLALSTLSLAAAMWCPPPLPPDRIRTSLPKRLVEGEIGLVEAQSDGGFGPPIVLPDGGVVSPTSVGWCRYNVTGPAGGAACFSKAPTHICIMCPTDGCPQSVGMAVVPNMPQSGNAAKLGCDMRIDKSPNAWACGACDPRDDDGPGGLGPFGGYFRF